MLKNLLFRGIDIDMIICEDCGDTPLIRAVQYGHLDMVRMLIQYGCDLDRMNTHNHTALDDAISYWCVVKTNPRADIGAVENRYKIMRCILGSGAEILSTTLLDMHIFTNRDIIEPLVQVFCGSGCVELQSLLLSVLVPYNRTEQSVRNLLLSGAYPEIYLYKYPARPYMPLLNAELMIQATNNLRVLNRVVCDITCYIKFSTMEIQMILKYETLLQMLILAGCQLDPFVVQFMSETCPTLYSWFILFSTQPKTLKHLSRMKVRDCCHGNIIHGVEKMDALPKVIQGYLLLKD